ncbi:MAG: hypothetical protein L0Z53_14430, partial [Acidobacteriales bacterium]|nr:hypothetical protein [Terriglobales bacterium]
WLSRWSYTRFILRELTSIFVAWTVLLVLMQMRALSQGPAAFAEFEAWMRSPVIVVLNLISLVFLVFHSITWFNLTPSALVVRIGGKRIPDFLIVAPNYVAWVIVSVVVAWIAMGG